MGKWSYIWRLSYKTLHLKRDLRTHSAFFIFFLLQKQNWKRTVHFDFSPSEFFIFCLIFESFHTNSSLYSVLLIMNKIPEIVFLNCFWFLLRCSFIVQILRHSLHWLAFTKGFWIFKRFKRSYSYWFSLTLLCWKLSTPKSEQKMSWNLSCWACHIHVSWK